MSRSRTSHDANDAALEARLQRWLREERGVSEYRRLAYADQARLVVSKFEPGFATRLGEVLRLAGLLDDLEALEAAYEASASHEPDSLRVEVWAAAACELVRARLRALGRGSEDAELLVAGIESVAAVMNAILWTGPLAGAPFEPAEGEREAYREALARADPASGLFTRHYGSFGGRAVVNHCPGASHARALLAAAWRACTGTTPPA